MSGAHLFVRRGHSLVPATDTAMESLGGLKEGARVLLSMRSPRNYRQHALLFAVLRKVVENSEWPNEEALLDALKIRVGHVDQRAGLDGKVYLTPRSINFAEMDQIKFRRFFDRVVDAVVREVIPGLGRSDLMEQVDGLLHPARSAA